MADFIEIPLYKGKVMVKFYPVSHQYWVSVDGDKSKRRPGVTTICGIKDKSIGLMSWQQTITADYLIGKIEAGDKVTTDTIFEAVVQNEVQRDKAASIGNEIHDWVSKYINFKLKKSGFKTMPEMPEHPQVVTGVNSFLDWEKAHKVKFLSSERVVFSRKHEFMGTLDIEAIVDGKHALVDLKSSNGLYNSVRAQTAAYVMADMEEDKAKKYEGRWAIRVSKFTEEEYVKKEERKKEMKRAIARIQGKEFNDFPIKPFVVFEAKDLDDGENFTKRDFEAFLAHQEVYKWDNLTNPYYKGTDW